MAHDSETAGAGSLIMVMDGEESAAGMHPSHALHHTRELSRQQQILPHAALLPISTRGKSRDSVRRGVLEGTECTRSGSGEDMEGEEGETGGEDEVMHEGGGMGNSHLSSVSFSSQGQASTSASTMPSASGVDMDAIAIPSALEVDRVRSKRTRRRGGLAVDMNAGSGVDVVGATAAAESSQKRKMRKCLDIETKLAIIRLVRGGKSHVSVANDFGVTRTTVSKMLKNASKIEAMSNELPTTRGRKSLRVGDHAPLEQELYKWYVEQQEQGVRVSGCLIKSKASELSARYSQTEFKASNGWLEGFKTRFSISPRRSVLSMSDGGVPSELLSPHLPFPPVHESLDPNAAHHHHHHHHHQHQHHEHQHQHQHQNHHLHSHTQDSAMVHVALSHTHENENHHHHSPPEEALSLSHQSQLVPDDRSSDVAMHHHHPHHHPHHLLAGPEAMVVAAAAVAAAAAVEGDMDAITGGSDASVHDGTPMCPTSDGSEMPESLLLFAAAVGGGRGRSNVDKTLSM